MARSKWNHLELLSILQPALSGRPEAIGARFEIAPRGRHVAVFDALPPAAEDERDDKDALRVRVFRHDGTAFTQLLEHTPSRVGYRFGDRQLGRAAVSDVGAVAFAVGSTVHVVRPDGKTLAFDAADAWPFFDPIAPARLRLLRHGDDGEVIETYDTDTKAMIESLPVGTGGGFPPQVDPETGDVLLFDGWYARQGGAHVAIEDDEPGNVLRVGHGTLHLPDDVERVDASRRDAAGVRHAVAGAFQAWRREDVWRARAPMLASTDGRWVFARWNAENTLFDAARLEPQPLPPIAPQHTLLGPGILAVLDEHLAVAVRFGLCLVDVRSGRVLGAGPVALLGLGLAGDRVVTLHEDGVRMDGGAVLAVAEPALDGLRIAPEGRFAAVLCGGAGSPAVILDLREGREVRRIGQAADIAWVAPGRLAVHGADGLRIVDVVGGATVALGELPAAARLGSDGSGRFFVGTATELIEHAADGAPRRTFTLPKKLKGYTWPTALVVHANEVYAVTRSRIFRWNEAGACERLTALENAVGGPKLDPALHEGRLRTVSVSKDGRWLAVTAKTPSGAIGVVVCDRDGGIAAWTGPIFGRLSEHAERTFCAFRGRDLVVGTEHGAVRVFRLPG